MSRVLLIGSGGREHALAAALVSSVHVELVIVSPGNAGTRSLSKAKNQQLNIKDHKEIIDFCLKMDISLVVIGPEDPLADGLTDSLVNANIKVFGPTKAAARIETSKAWSKYFMKRNSIPTSEFNVFEIFEDAEDFIENSTWESYVIKASGLAGGKGVIVADDKENAKLAIRSFKCNKSSKIVEASKQIVLEKKLSGFEISVIAFSDGSNIQVLPPVQDHKQRFAGGMGANTGGMGAYCPCPLVSTKDLHFIEKSILQRTVDEMKSEGYAYVGALYAGIMITDAGPMVLEFNCRFGDPETQALIPLYSSDMFSTMQACADGRLVQNAPALENKKFSAAVSIVIENYPNDVEKGLDLQIKGIESVKDTENCFIYFAGTKFDEELKTYKTSGGRVLSVCSVGRSLQEALSRALSCASKISFESSPLGFGADFRGDIGFQSIKRLNERRNRKLTYSNVGVNVVEGNRFVNTIKQFCEQTKRAGVKSDLGMFGAVFDTQLEGYSNPLLISGTDGVGTKLKVATEAGCHDSVGQDLVAMCVNDILVHAAEPLFFLDYFASGKLDPKYHSEIIKGISNGCLLAGCSLVGGETAEMPGMYSEGDYDIAGFVVGAVNEENLLPKLNEMKAGNILIGIASSGLHSNGFTLIRKVLETLSLNPNKSSPFNPKQNFYKELLKPTHIYRPLLKLLRSGLILGAAHVTGGGIEENILRVVPSHLGVQIKANWKIPSIFAWLATLGLDSYEMLATFNLGIGLILIAEAKDEKEILRIIDESFTSAVTEDQRASYPKSKIEDDIINSAWVIGALHNSEEQHRFEICGLNESLLKNGACLIDDVPNCISWAPKLRTAVLISGSGTNLQALLDHTMSGLSRVEIVLVTCNVAGVQGLRRAAEVEIPTVVIPHKEYPSRENFECEIQKILVAYDVEIVCLAGFMRILTGSFVRKWQNRMINIHPSLLPSFKGKDAQKQALEAGVCVTGCTVHFVTEEVDAGAIITQEPVFVLKDDSVESLTERIKKAEHKAYPRALEMVAREIQSSTKH